jgi:hypothetical protein
MVRTLLITGSGIFAGTVNQGVWRSTNNGVDWAAANDGLASSTVNAIAAAGTTLFAGTWGEGVLASTDDGGHWTPVNDGLIGTIVWSLAVSGADLMAGTSGTSVWRRPLAELVTSVERSPNGPPVNFALGQNYPNPFNPSTRIHYALPQRAHVTLAVYNTLGQKVVELVNAEKEVGTCEVTFNANGLASGVYLYRIQAGSFVQTKKLVLLR